MDNLKRSQRDCGIIKQGEEYDKDDMDFKGGHIVKE